MSNVVRHTGETFEATSASEDVDTVRYRRMSIERASMAIFFSDFLGVQ
jgi:hypothetical protein